MMPKVRKIDFLCTATEKEALLLEASLIKKHRPRYNIVLRDDKQYILFSLSRTHPFPALRLTRKVSRDGSVYFGPFTSALSARETKRVIDRLFPLRKCRDTVMANRVRPCLQYHIGRCLGPCCLPVSEEEYRAVARQVELFLSGKSAELLSGLHAEMTEAAGRLDFEQAARLRDSIRALRDTVERQAAVLDTLLPETVRRTVRLSVLPLMRFSGHLDNLLGYPYGCSEQTVSKAFPLLYFGSLAKQLAPGRFSTTGPAGLVHMAIRRLQTMQTSSGGYGYWPGAETDPWVSAYVCHFLLEAMQVGHTVPKHMINHNLNYQ